MRSSTKRGTKGNTGIPTGAPEPARKAGSPPAASTAAKTEGTRVYARRPASNKDRVLAQWRGIDLRGEEVTLRSTDRAAGAVVGNVLKKLRLDQRQAETEIVKVWNHLIDPNIAAHAQPAGVHKGTLFVNVDSSVWLDEIVRYRRKEILTRLQTAFGREMVQRISFRVA